MHTVDNYAKYRTAHRDGMTIRQIARTFHVSRRKVRDALASPEPKPYTRSKPPPALVLGPFQAIINQVLRDDRDAPPKQRHTAAQLCRRLQDEHGYPGSYPRSTATWPPTAGVRAPRSSHWPIPRAIASRPISDTSTSTSPTVGASTPSW